MNWDGQSIGNNPGILYSGSSGTNGYGIMLRSGDGTVQKLTILLGNVQYLSTTTPLPTNSWHHVAAVRENGTWVLYLDGVAQTLNSNTWTPHVPTGKCTIGSLSSGTQKFKGKIDEVRIWTVARTQAQIQTSYASLAGNETGLAAYWRLDDGSGSTSGDGSGHGKTASLYGSPVWGTSTAPVETPLFSASPASYDFGNVLVGERSTQNITVSNPGGGVLHLTSISTPGADFSITPATADILSGGNQVFTTSFSPTSSAAQSGDLSFTSNIGTSTVTLTGTGVFEAQAGAAYAVDLDGIDDYLEMTGVTMAGAVTVEFWVKPESYPTSGTSNYLLVKGNMAGSKSYFIEQYPERFCIRLNPSSTAVNFGSVSLNSWTHLAFSYDGSTLKTYTNGTLSNSAVLDVTPTACANTLVLGYKWSASSYGSAAFDGQLDEIRIWSTARSQDQIQASYASQAGNETGLVSYWRFDEGTGTTSGDATGGSLSAALNNGAAWVNSTAPVTAPVYQTSSSSLAFGNVDVNSTSDETFTITNSGGGFLAISSLVSDNSLFTVSPASANIAAGGNQAFTATFAPTTHGAASGSLTLTHNPNAATHTVSLGGTGQQALFSASTATLAFETVQVGIGSDQTLTVTNDGNITLNITEIVCDPAVYSITPTTATIAASGSQEFVLTLTANSVGSTPGTITFTDNALNTPQAIACTATAVSLLGSGTLEDPYQIGYLSDLRYLSEHSSLWGTGVYFIQTTDIDASESSTWNSAAGFSPIGIPGMGYFQGTYDGNYHTIDGLVINRSGTDYQGLFGVTNSATIKNLNLTNVSVTGKAWVGALVGNNGYGSASSIEKCSSAGSVTGNGEAIGGLVGENESGSSITNSFSNCATTMSGNNWSCGGLVGHNPSSSVINCYATGTVTGMNAVGGLVGNNTSGITTNCFSTGEVSGGGSYIGGLIGGFSYQVNNSFWDTQTSGQASSAGGTGKTTAEMQVRATFTGWDFKDAGTNDIWNMGNGRNGGYPYLDWEYPSDPVIELATVSTITAGDITTTSATSGGEVSSNASGEAVTQRGLCWSTSADPTIAGSHTANGSGTGTYSVSISGLTTGTTYHIRSYATNLAGTSYGDDLSFTTLLAPVITTQAVTEINTTTATGNGNITTLGIPNPSQHGVCWSTEANPEFARGNSRWSEVIASPELVGRLSRQTDALRNPEVPTVPLTREGASRTEEGAATTTGPFTSLMTGLTPHTTYHVRAYATNAVTTVYGEDVTFTSLELPTVTTQAVSDISTTTATGNASITDLGYPDPTQYGVCWGPSTNPTIADSKTEEGGTSATGAFTSDITGLSSGETYHVRAYATNAAGTVYGDDVSFTALQLPTVTTQAVSSIGIGSATGNGNITDLGVPNPTQHGVCWSTSTGPTISDYKSEDGAVSATGAFTSAMTGLSGLTTYYVRAYATNTAGTHYGSEVSFTTAATEPTTQAQNIVCDDLDLGTFTLSWTNGNGSSRAVFLKEAATGEAAPVDNSSYTANTVFGSGSQIGEDGWYCVYNGSGTSVIVTGLSQNSTYRAMVCEYNGGAGGENYLTATATDNPANNLLAYFVEADGVTLTQTSSSNAAWGDIDNDDDLDLLVMGSGSFQLMKNNGDGSFSAIANHGILTYLTGNPPHWVDLDNDGYLDLFICYYNYLLVYRNNHDYTFTQTVNINTGMGISGVWADYDLDGYQDLLVTGCDYNKLTRLYRNNQDGTFSYQDDIVFDQFGYSTASWADYDNDGYPDLFLTGFTASGETAKLYRNIAGTSFQAQTSGMPWLPVYYSAAEWGDYNSDGYLDLAVTGESNSQGEIAKIYTNNGGTSFTLENFNLHGVIRPSLAWGDYDGDGDLDLLVSGDDWGAHTTKLYMNAYAGSYSFTEQTSMGLAGFDNGSCVWGDYDNDRDLDLLVTGTTTSNSGITKLYRNLGAATNTVPGAPSDLLASVDLQVQLSWTKASDTQTPQNGLTYNLYIGSASGSGNSLEPMANTTNGFRQIVRIGNSGSSASHVIRNLPGGTYYWGVQAVDHGFCGGSFATGATFNVAVQSTDIVFSDQQASSLTLGWTAGEMDNRVVFMKEAASGTPAPEDNTTYTANAAFGFGSQIGSSGWYCVYNGSGSTVAVTNLTPTATYRVMVCEYSGSTGSENFLLTTPAGNPATLTMPYFIEQTGITLAAVQDGSVAWGDYDNDGDADILLTGEGASRLAKIYKNNGNNTFTEQTGIVLPGVMFSQGAWQDYDNDGYLDFVLAGTSNSGVITKLYRNNQDGSFSEQTGSGLAAMYYGELVWGDVDRDGFSDLILSGRDGNSNAMTKLYHNNGDNSFSEQSGTGLPASSSGSLDLGDYDGDGDLDVVIFGYDNVTNAYPRHVYRNEGDGSFSIQSGISLPITCSGSVRWGDYDSDGDLDLLVSGFSATNVYRNNGNNTFTTLTGTNLPGMSESQALWGDYDNDGDLDILVAGYTGSSTYRSCVYRYNGDQTYSLQDGFDLAGVHDGTLAWADYDNDGDLDILLTGNTGTTRITKLYQNVTPNANAAPSAPVNLAVNSAATVSFSWDKSTDTETAQNALSYNLFIGNSSSTCENLAPAANISTGQRRLTAMGNMQLLNAHTMSGLSTGTYYWGVQALDNAFQASPFTLGNSFFYLPPPSSQASELSFSNQQSDQLTLSWVNGNGDNRAVFVLQSTMGAPVPVDDVAYTASASFGSGSQIGSSGWYCVYNGTSTSVTVTNIGSNSSYRFAVIEYNEQDGHIRYLGSTGTANPRTRYQSISGSGLALAFDGVNDHVALPAALGNTLSGGSALTIEYWFKGSQLQSPFRLQDGNGYIVAGWEANNPVHIISTDGGTSGVSVGSQSIVEDGSWHHLAMSWESNTTDGFRSYLDGVLVDSRNSANANLPVFTDIQPYLGSIGGTGEFLNGSLDEVRIWNVARSQSDICANMCRKLIPANETDLVAYYNFDGVAGTDGLSELKNAYTGTLINCDIGNAWIASGVPLGDLGNALTSITPTCIGATGQSCLVTITSNPDVSNFINLYVSPGSGGIINIADVGSWPDGTVRRADIIWGVHAVGNVTADLVFTYGSLCEDLISDQVQLLKRAHPGTPWIDVSTDFIHDAVAHTFTRLNNASFSEYTLGSGGDDTSLPVELSEFGARQELKSVDLTWTTDSEVENLGFIIERKTASSLDGAQDAAIVEVASYLSHEGLVGQGSSNEAHQYNFVDTDIHQGGEYIYYLHDVDYQGQQTLLDSVQILIEDQEWLRIPDEFSFGNVYPNPFNPRISLPFALPEAAEIRITVYDIRGREVLTLASGNYAAGRHTLVWNGTNALGRKAASGVYILSCSVQGLESGSRFQFNRKVLKLE